MGTEFFVHDRIVSAVKRVEFVSDVEREEMAFEYTRCTIFQGI
jgi:hypothetical protein